MTNLIDHAVEGEMKDEEEAKKDENQDAQQQAALPILHISVSDVAAMTGFHPYQDLPETMLKYVYQDRFEWLKHDANLLGIELVDQKEDLYLEMAKQAGSDTFLELQNALKILQSTTAKDQLPTIQDVNQRKDKVVELAMKSKQLDKNQIRFFHDGISQIMNTGFGTIHEDNALDLYEQQYCQPGFQVEQRNTETMQWYFYKKEDVKQEEQEQEQEQQLQDVSEYPTVVPLQKASIRKKHKKNNAVSHNSNYPVAQHNLELSEEETKSQPASAKQVLVDLTNESKGRECFCQDNVESDKGSNKHNEDSRNSSKLTTPLPYFSIRGKVDGIRQEYVPNSTARIKGDSNDNDDKLNHNVDENDDIYDSDSWVLKDVIVEIKHRMNKIYYSPPLHEQIQAILYCFMYDVQDADIVQVLRRKTTALTRSDNQSHDDKHNQQKSNTDKTDEQKVKPCKNDENDSNADTSKISNIDNNDRDKDNNRDNTITNIHNMNNDSNNNDNSNDRITNSSNKNKNNNTKQNELHQQTQQARQKRQKVGQKKEIHDTQQPAITKYFSSLQEEKRPQQQQQKEEVDDELIHDDGKNHSSKDHNEVQNNTVVTMTTSNIIESGNNNNNNSTGECDEGCVANNSNVACKKDGSSDIVVADAISPSVPPTLSVSRILLDDPIMSHRYHFKTIILPRLRSFVDAIFTIRNNDDKRYRLLLHTTTANSVAALSTSTDTANGTISLTDGSDETKSLPSSALAWDIVHNECPWLLSCDTAHQKDR